MSVAIILPAYNEEMTIEKCVLEFHKQLPEAQIFVIDNNSNDHTKAIAEKAILENGIHGNVLFEGRQGKGNALRKAFREVEADLYILADADLTYPAEEVHLLLKKQKNENLDMVTGDRISSGQYDLENKRHFHSFGNRLVRGLINYFFKANQKDILTGYRVMTHRFVKNFPVLSEGFEIETEMTLHALDKKFPTGEVMITYKDRPKGSISKLNTFSDGVLVLKSIVKILKDYKPLPFFSAFAAIFFILGCVIGFPVIMEYIERQYIYKVPSAILAAGLMIFSLISFAIGLILDTIKKFHRFSYELNVLRGNTHEKH